MVAADPGTAPSQIAAVQKVVNDFGDDGAQDAAAGVVGVGVKLRVTMLPDKLKLELQQHLQRVRFDRKLLFM